MAAATNATYYTVRIIFHDVDAKFDTKVYNATEAMNIQMMMEDAVGHAADVILLPPKDNGVTSGDALVSLPREPPATTVKSQYTMEAYKRAFLIKCTDPTSDVRFANEKYLYLSNYDPEPVAYWNAKLDGWIVPARYEKDAEEFIANVNSDNYDPYMRDMDWEYGNTFCDIYESYGDTFYEEDCDYDYMYKESEPELYTITRHGKGYLIGCDEPSMCDFWETPYLALREPYDKDDEVPVAYWNKTLNGWVVKGRDFDTALCFIEYANYYANRDDEEAYAYDDTMDERYGEDGLAYVCGALQSTSHDDVVKEEEPPKPRYNLRKLPGRTYG